MQAVHQKEVTAVSVNKALKSAVQPIVPICVPNVYTGDSAEYTTFNYTEIPDEFGDDQPWLTRYLVYLHWYLPEGINPLSRKRAIRQALISAGFTAPTSTDASDEDGHHFVFECEWMDGGV